MQNLNQPSLQISDLVAWLFLLIGIGFILTDAFQPEPLSYHQTTGPDVISVAQVSPPPAVTPTTPPPTVTPPASTDPPQLDAIAFLNSSLVPDVEAMEPVDEADEANEIVPRKNWGQPLYYFPYPAGEVKITRGGQGHHNGNGPAYDFAVGADAPVLAARAGVVVRADYSHYDPDCTSEEDVNQVVVDHGDGTYGVYLHFAYSRPVLTVGDDVAVGDILGYTGCTGQANGPHVHFHISDRFNPNNPADIGHLIYRLPIWFFEAGEGDQVPPLDVEADAPQIIWSHNPVVDAVPPTGRLLTPFDGAIIDRILKIKGWAVDNTAVAHIEIYLDGDYLGQATYQTSFPNPDLSCDQCGYDAEFDLAGYSPGAHVLSIKLIDAAGNSSKERWYILLRP